EQWLDTLLNVHREATRVAWKAPLSTPRGEVLYSPRAVQVLLKSSKVLRAKGTASTGHLLLAIMSDGLSGPSRAMDKLGTDRKSFLEELQAELQSSSGTALPVSEQDRTSPGAG